MEALQVTNKTTKRGITEKLTKFMNQLDAHNLYFGVCSGVDFNIESPKWKFEKIITTRGFHTHTFVNRIAFLCTVNTETLDCFRLFRAKTFYTCETGIMAYTRNIYTKQYVLFYVGELEG